MRKRWNIESGRRECLYCWVCIPSGEEPEPFCDIVLWPRQNGSSHFVFTFGLGKYDHNISKHMISFSTQLGKEGVEGCKLIIRSEELRVVHWIPARKGDGQA
jgi:hypothetical protein